MAEAVALFLINKISEALVTEGIAQANFMNKNIHRVHSQMHEIKARFELMQAFLEHADKNYTIDNKALATWVKQVRELAFKIEDIIDEYTYIMASRKQGNGGITARLYNKLKAMNNIKKLNDIAEQLQSVSNTLRVLSEDKNTFDIKMPDVDHQASTSISSIALNESLQLAESAYTIPDDNIIGIDDHKALLINWLQHDEESERKVISIWGMGGVGKTTLVTSVYKSPSIVSHFECRAWVSVSQNYNRYDLLRKIIRELYRGMDSAPSSLESMDYKSLVEILHKFLMQKRYLIVLDDVWITTVWHDLVNVVYDNDMKSRVVITTRNQEVAHVTDENHILELKPLDDYNASTLFYHYAFRKQKNRDCPIGLREWAEKIVNKCGGLPLALVWIGNYLATKEQSEFVWKTVYNLLISSGDQKNETIELNRINRILSLSIANLPYYLRSCFLYCSIFPEDYEIKRKTLLRLWVSEGFVVKERGGSTKMDVAQDYLNQLVCHSMFYVVERNGCGRIKTLKIHDLVREIIIEKRQSESFYELWDGNIKRQQGIENIRCLSIVNLDEEDDNGSGLCTPQLRSLHFFSKLAASLLVSNFKLLRVLNLEGCEKIQNLPEEVGTLFNLRYLSIRRTRVKLLPKSICRLRNLETLDTRSYYFDTNEDELQGLSESDKLQHLIGDHLYIKQIQNFKNVQTLKGIIATDDLVKDLGSLKELRNLQIMWVRSSVQSLELAAFVAKTKSLVTLKIHISSGSLQLDGSGLNSLPSQLQTLLICGPLEKGLLPECLLTASNLKALILINSDLKEDPIPTLALSLPNLLYLQLDGCCELADKLCFPAGSFRELKDVMIGCMGVKMIEIHKESLVSLERMRLFICYELKTLPVGIENLTNLKLLELHRVPDELINKLRKESGHEESLKVQHVRLIKPCYIDNIHTIHHEVL